MKPLLLGGGHADSRAVISPASRALARGQPLRPLVKLLHGPSLAHAISSMSSTQSQVFEYDAHGNMTKKTVTTQTTTTYHSGSASELYARPLPTYYSKPALPSASWSPTLPTYCPKPASSPASWSPKPGLIPYDQQQYF